jgi:hypothetical protein
MPEGNYSFLRRRECGLNISAKFSLQKRTTRGHDPPITEGIPGTLSRGV